MKPETLDSIQPPGRKSVIQSHVRDSGDRMSIAFSIAAHLFLVLLLALSSLLLPDAELITLGSGSGGGSGDFIEVGLVADSSGGEGMYKPSIVPRPASPPLPPPEPEPQASTEGDEVPEELFVEKSKPVESQVTPAPAEAKEEDESRQEEPRRLNTASAAKEPEARSDSTTVPREADAGKPGTGGGGLGSGEGQGTQSGVGIGLGSGEGKIDSWYVRQVEKRVAQNWLKTSLGQLGRQVRAVVTFRIQPDGQITDISLDESSRQAAVDRAALRAIQASNPLPPLPYEFRRRTVTFQAVFEYPPQ